MTVVGVTLAAFIPSLRNDFNYDDQANIIENPHYRGLGWDNLQWMFTTFHMGHYQPLSWVSLAVDSLLWKDRPFGYHLTNLVLHLANTLLVYTLAMKLLRGAFGGGSLPNDAGKIPVFRVKAERSRTSPRAENRTAENPKVPFFMGLGAALATLLFAVHPLRVESVAWVTERRDVLSSFFLLAVALAYVHVHQRERVVSRRRWLPLVLALYTLSLLSRAMGVTLPVVLLILDWYPLRRLGGGSGRWFGREARIAWLEKVPFFILAAATAILAPLAQRHVGAAVSLADYPLQSRLAQACYALLFYLWKTLAPFNLVPLYELHPPIRLLDMRYLLSAVGVLAAGVVVALVGRRRPAVAAAALCYAVLLSPVLGLVQSGEQEVADRYSYLPAVGWAVLMGAGASRLWQFASRPRRAAPAVTAALMAVIAVWSVLTWRQCRVWKDHYTLWSYAVAHGPPCATAHSNVACVLAKQDRTEQAVQHFRKALEINPRYPDAWYNLGNALTELRQPEEALAAYRQAVAVNPDFAQAHYELARTLSARGDRDDALEHYRQAIELKPDYVKAHINLGNLLRKKGQPEAALEAYRQALRIHPRNTVAYYNLAVTLKDLGQNAEALEAVRQVLRLDPNHTAAQRLWDGLQKQQTKPPD